MNDNILPWEEIGPAKDNAACKDFVFFMSGFPDTQMVCHKLICLFLFAPYPVQLASTILD